MASTNKPRRTILVTGFGGFPGSPRNPTQRIVTRLLPIERRLDRLGVALLRDVLPVVYADLPDRLAGLAARHRPDVILHLGVAGRRRHVCVELRATSFANPLHVDASRRRPQLSRRPGEPLTIRATYPAPALFHALKKGDLPARLSHDAGDYVCNATLYRSLTSRLAPTIGFIHVPRPQRASQRVGRSRFRRPTEAALVAGIERVLLVLARRPHREHDRSAASPHTDTVAATRTARSSSEMVRAGVK